jgi:hypothetical protein
LLVESPPDAHSQEGGSMSLKPVLGYGLCGISDQERVGFQPSEFQEDFLRDEVFELAQCFTAGGLFSP